MGEHSKELPIIRQKRDGEELAAQNSSDLFAKRPRFEFGQMTNTEDDRRNDRRQKNKEAAEKSRRKKKDEFSQIQTENDQLQQDKCQLVALIESLKSDLNKVTKENNGLRYNIDHLKRWIGKHARDLGLGKHIQKKGKAEEKVRMARDIESRDSDNMLRGDPSLHSTGVVADQEQDHPLSDPTSPSLLSASRLSPSSFETATPSPTPMSKHLFFSVASIQAESKSSSIHDFFLPVGIRTAVSLPQQPVPLVEEDNQHGETGEQKVAVHASSHQLSKDTVFIVHDEGGEQLILHDEGGQQLMMVAPKVQQEVRVDAPEVHQVTMVNCHVQQNSVEASEVQMTSVDALEVRVERPEIQVTSMEAIDAWKKSVEAPEVQITVEALDIQEASSEVPEIQEASAEGPHASHITMKATELQTVSGYKKHKKETLNGDTNENYMAAKDTTGERKIESELPNVNIGYQPSLVNTIDALLKMGYKIQLPGGAQLLTDPKQTTLAVDQVLCGHHTATKP